MQPDTPQAEPTQTPNSQQPTQGTQPPKKSRLKLVAGLIVLVAVIAGGLLTLQLHNTGHTTNNQKTNPVPHGDNNPAKLAGIAVGSFAYVPACRVLTAENQQDLFAGISESALVETSFADDGLPVNAIPAGGVESDCSRTFGSDTPYANTTLTFNVDQFPTTQAAQKQYSNYTVSQSDLDKANATFKSNVTTDFLPLSGVSDTVYGSKEHIAYTLAGNKILSFTAILGDISDDTFKQALVHAIPTIVNNANTLAASRVVPDDTTVFGHKVGDATIYNPCKLYTGDDYKTAAGHYQNPTNVHLRYNYGSATIAPDDVHDGWAQDTCTRYAYPGTSSGVQSMETEFHYYKSATEAAMYVKQNVQKQSSDSFYKVSAEPVQGVGSYAAYLKPKDSGNLSDFYVQQGPYVLVLHGTTSGTNGSSPASNAQYQAFAKVLLPKLK